MTQLKPYKPLKRSYRKELRKGKEMSLMKPILICISLGTLFSSITASSRTITETDTEKFSQELQIVAKEVIDNRQSGKKPVVIFDNAKGSIPITDVIPQEADEDAENIAAKKRNDQIVENFKSGAITPEQYQQQIIDELFPVRSKLKPQKVMVRHQVISAEAARTITTPVAVIGSDEYSLNWYKANLGEIRRLNAFVLVTQVANMQDYMVIRNYAKDVMMQPSTADGFLHGLGISYYPVLVTPQGAFQ